MKSLTAVFLAVFIALAVACALFAFSHPLGSGRTPTAAAETVVPVLETEETPALKELPEAPLSQPPATLTPPISDALNRVTKKTFGLKIEPGHSPVPNDRFSGYHVGVDFETVESEQDTKVPVYAICAGPLLFKKFAGGYGGLAVQKCRIDGKDVTVMYGHLNLASILPDTGDDIAPGEQIGLLGKGFSAETDGVRKHLHLGIHVGTETDIRGYVQDEAEVSHWLDVLAYLPR